MVLNITQAGAAGLRKDLRRGPTQVLPVPDAGMRRIGSQTIEGTGIHDFPVPDHRGSADRSGIVLVGQSEAMTELVTHHAERRDDAAALGFRIHVAFAKSRGLCAQVNRDLFRAMTVSDE